MTALEFSPFHDAQLATGAEDGSLKVWDLGSGDANVADPLVSLGADKRIWALAYNPVADGILATGSGDGIVRVWDVEAGAEAMALPAFGAQVQGLAWDYAGRNVVVTSKDKMVRIYDPRAGGEGPIAEGPGHEGIKASRVVWMGDSSRFATTGFDKYRSREIRVYDMAGSLDAPVSKTKLDSSSGVLMPLYDPDTKLLFIGGKGDVATRFYEDTQDGKLLEAGSVGSREQTVGLALTPKSVLDLWNCQVARVLKLTSSGSIVPVSFKVPRKSYAKFHPELYPDTRGTTPGTSGAAWIGGEDGTVPLVSLQPEGERPREPTATGASAPPPSSSSSAATSSAAGGGSAKVVPKAAVKARKWSTSSSSGGSSKWASKRSSWAPPAKKDKEEEEPEADPDVPPEGMREVVVPKNIVRASKFRHIHGKENKKEEWVTNLRIDDNFSVESSSIAASDTLFAVPWTGAGGQIGVFPLSHEGRIGVDAPTICQTSSFNCFEFAPFNANLLATASDDGRVGLWEIPSTGLEANLEEPSMVLEGHRHRVSWVTWAPYVESLLASGSFDSTIRLWDVDAGACLTEMDCFEAEPTGIAFSYDNSTLATAARDKVLRIHDPRADGGGVVAQVENAHSGVKPFKVLWLGEGDKVATVGFGERSKREIKVWDVRSFSDPIATQPLSTSSNLALPFYDVQTSVMFLAGKGDGSIKAFEINDKGIHELSAFNAVTPQAGLAILPKSTVDVVQCQFASFVKLSGSSVSRVTFTVPRAKKEFFQDDVFVPTPGFDPVCNAAEWFASSPGAPPLKDLRPEGMPLLSENNAAKPKVIRKWVPTKEAADRDTRSSKDKLLDSFEGKMKGYETDVLPQDANEGAAEEEW